MKAFVITMKDLPESMRVAKRCVDSAPELEIAYSKAITPKDNPEKIARKKGISVHHFMEKYSRYENCLSAFLSHHELWEGCVWSGEPYLILEHDAVVKGKINPMALPLGVRACVNLGAPSYGRFVIPPLMGLNKLVSKQYFPGAHAYYVTPEGAKELIQTAKLDAAPTDVYLHNTRFDFLQEFYPWPVVAKDSFTTIQNEVGCAAKHNYKKGSYEIL